MRRRIFISVAFLILLAWTAIFAFQRRGPRFLYEEDNPAPVPPDANVKTEYTFARLRYPSLRFGGYWGFRGNWATDYPKADRQFVQGVRRLTRIHSRSVEQVVDLESDEIFKYPWVYAVEVGHWNLNDVQAAKLREYLLRGGFLMTDDFHGTWEWDIFMASMRRVFPDRPVVDIENKDEIFHVLYDLDERVQVPGIVMFRTGRTYEQDGVEPAWGGVYDDRGRLMVAICHNMDLGDAWEWADYPQYPERYASLAYRIGINYIIYAMTHQEPDTALDLPMFEFFFKYPPAAFTKGEFVLLGRLPAWVLFLAVLAAFALLGWAVWRRRAEWIASLSHVNTMLSSTIFYAASPDKAPLAAK